RRARPGAGRRRATLRLTVGRGQGSEVRGQKTEGRGTSPGLPVGPSPFALRPSPFALRPSTLRPSTLGGSPIPPRGAEPAAGPGISPSLLPSSRFASHAHLVRDLLQPRRAARHAPARQPADDAVRDGRGDRGALGSPRHP